MANKALPFHKCYDLEKNVALCCIKLALQTLPYTSQSDKITNIGCQILMIQVIYYT